jgi:hypothetical protein
MKYILFFFIVLYSNSTFAQKTVITNLPYYPKNDTSLFGKYEENAYFARMMKLAGNKKISLFELQGFNHGAMVLPGIHLMFQEIDKILNNK